jgi:hypothetical protein
MNLVYMYSVSIIITYCFPQIFNFVFLRLLYDDFQLNTLYTLEWQDC